MVFTKTHDNILKQNNAEEALECDPLKTKWEDIVKKRQMVSTGCENSWAL